VAEGVVDALEAVEIAEQDRERAALPGQGRERLVDALAVGQPRQLVLQRQQGQALPAAELARLRPARIVVVGGAAAVSDAVLDEVRGYAAAAG
jgi:hypothetical protein